MSSDYRQSYEDWTKKCPEFKAELEAMTEGEIEDAFSKDLKFGTAGLRGVMGAGTNRMNVYVVRRATQGLSEHLNENYDNPTVAIAYDSRNNSRLFAEESARVLAGNGIKTYIYDELMPVPVLSFTVRELECTCGIVITASHNSREYNGYKVYGSDGAQILESEAESILKKIGGVDIFDGVKAADFTPSDEGLISYVDEKVYEAYMKAMLAATDITEVTDVDILYTPLNGSGRRPVTDMFARCGFDIRIVKEQELPDGDFPTCTYPNPEKPETYKVALEHAEGCDIIVATDPDCDRVGCMVRHEGAYRLFSGNDIGTVISYFLASQPGAEGKTIVSSLVSTPLIDAIAVDKDVKVVRTLVGFKWIGAQMNELGENFLFGFEESNGYLTGLYARDKDGVCGARLLCSLAAYYKAQGKTLVDVLDEIYEKYGTCLNETVSLETEGAPLMKKVREADIPGLIDYGPGICGLPPADIIQMSYVDDSRLIIRPSGTEQKVKLYISASDKDRVEEILSGLKKIIG
ncbi:MAG: phospho-sugar mutase [Firmicutes bacterium]|nr:phospho-sugar mutase [Bacillota bacterium]